MKEFHFIDEEMFCEGVKLTDIAAEFGTPCFVYSRSRLAENYHSYARAFNQFDDLAICYAVKSNSNLSLLKTLIDLGAGLDIVSIGELERGLLAGCDPSKIVFSGVGKQSYEIERALSIGIRCFNIESAEELHQIQSVASSMGKKAPVAFRINPNVDAGTHPYTSTGLKSNKFGVPSEDALTLYLEAAQLSHIDIIGIDFHIGSQINEIAPFIDSLKKILETVDEIEAHNIRISCLDIGGGIGVHYKDEPVFDIQDYARQVQALTDQRKMKLILEPGRSISADAGILLTKVLYRKSNSERNFAILDAGMNDLLRPSLYGAWHDVIIAHKKQVGDRETTVCDIVGPVCESGDFFAKGRPFAGMPGDLMAIMNTGAYCATMASNYNSRGRCAEVLVDGNQTYLIRRRETFDDQVMHEKTDYFLKADE